MLGWGDLRSSGLVAGVGLSLLLATVLLAVGVRWRGRSWPRRLAGIARTGVVGLVALATLAIGVPEFLQERFGLLLSPDDLGVRSVTIVDDTFVAVGAARSGAAWVSEDAATWTPVAVPDTLVDADIVDLVHVSDGVVAIAHDDAHAVLLTVTAGTSRPWAETDRFAHEVFGVVPMAADSRGRQVVLACDIYGNDVAFFHGEPPAALTVGAPEPVFDRGYTANDVACAVDGCAAVGARIRIGAAIWHSPDGAAWERIDIDLPDAEFVAVTSTPDGFVAVGNATATQTGVAWRSADGRAWVPLSGSEAFASATIDGVAVLDGTMTVFGRDPDAPGISMWRRTDDGRWARTHVTPATPGSRLRHLSTDGEVIVGVGVDAATASGAVWSSRDGRSWTRTILEPPR